MNIVNGAKNPLSSATVACSPEKLVIHDRTDARVPFEKLLKAVQIAIKVLFFIACGAAATVLERLREVKKTSSNAGAGPSAGLSAGGQPQSIKVPVLPIDNYSRLNSDRIIESLAGLSSEQLRLIREFEATHRHRSRILEAIDQHLVKNP